MNKEDLKRNIIIGIKEGKKIAKNIGKKISQKIEEAKDKSSNDYNDYIKYYDYTFEEREFNEIDNVILSMLTYVNYKDIVSETKKKISLEEVAKIFFDKYTKSDIDKYFPSDKEGVRLLKEVSNKKRFKDIKLFNYAYRYNDGSQFSAVTFDLGNNYYYVGFEGTDELVSGWKEDCKMSYEFPVEAHTLAKKYINKFTISNAKLIVGGHSKGGNLALVASMYANFFVKMRIKKVYSNDGPGLRQKQFESKRYKKIENKFIHIIPNSSIVGLFLKHKNSYRVVRSNVPGFLSHYPGSWQINYNTFERAKLSRFSRVFDEGFSKWLNKYDEGERELFVESIFSILADYNINTLLQFKKNYKLIFNVLKSTKGINPVVKEMAKDLLKVISKTNLEYPLL